MAQATVKTVQYVDPRIEPQPDPVYDYVIAPTQNQYYSIPASGLSNSSITFNNLTTLGIDRAYLDTFEIEITAEINFRLKKYYRTAADHTYTIGDITAAEEDAALRAELCPMPDSWTFQSFPFNTCCDEARVNINGGAFFSQPMCYVRAKERYMNQYELSKCYENVCPIHKPVCQTESTQRYDETCTLSDRFDSYLPFSHTAVDTTITVDDTAYTGHATIGGLGNPTRYGIGMNGFMMSDQGMEGGFNNSIVRLGKPRKNGDVQIGWENYYRKDKDTTTVLVTWREPLFVSPFSSRYDATYGRPLYNITSMDFSFTLMKLENMIRVMNTSCDFGTLGNTEQKIFVDSYTIDIKTANLLYQVMTIPATIQKPITTLVPYRRFVPYITVYNVKAGTGSEDTTITNKGATDIEITSGVYTLNEIPTAIWVFCAPTKDIVQMCYEDRYIEGVDPGISSNNPFQAGGNCLFHGNWDSNKLFAYMKHIDISMANTTQILNTAQVPDLYRIAKANGCQDSYLSWAVGDCCCPKNMVEAGAGANAQRYATKIYDGAGSVLRLKPGVDLIVPDIPLIPAANANNMVLQVRAKFDIPPHSTANNNYALWLLFEYVGVASISPGQCEITMNPLGNGEVMAVSPVMSATSTETEGTVEGSGFWDKVRKHSRIAAQIANEGIISRILKHIPGAQGAAEWARSHGLGEPGVKRSRGGAVMGKGFKDWM